MIKYLFNWLNDYPLTALELGDSFTKEIHLSKKLGIQKYKITEIEGCKSSIKNKVLLSLSENYINYYFIDINNKDTSKKIINNYIIWNLQTKGIDLSNNRFEYIKIDKNKFLVMFFKESMINKIINDYKLEKVVIMPDFLGTFNYWKYINYAGQNNNIILRTRERSTEILFIKKNVLQYATSIDIGAIDILEINVLKSIFTHINIKSYDNLSMRWIGEVESIIKHYMIETKENIEYTIELMGYEMLKESIIKQLGERVNIKINKESTFIKNNLPFINLIGNLYALHNKK